jgi:hypothetical protein
MGCSTFISDCWIWWIPKSSPGDRTSSLDLILPPAACRLPSGQLSFSYRHTNAAEVATETEASPIPRAEISIPGLYEFIPVGINRLRPSRTKTRHSRHLLHKTVSFHHKTCDSKFL